MKYKANVQLKKADTTGGVPASVLDEFVRQALLGQIGTVLKPHLTIRQATLTGGSPPADHQDRVEFSTELIILPGEQWSQFKERLAGWCQDVPADKAHQLQALLNTLDTTP